MTNSLKAKVIFIWAVVIAITALLVTLLIIKIDHNKSYDSYSDLERSNLVIKDVVGEEGSYYVFIYSSNDDYDEYKKEELEEVITRYATYVHRNSNDADVNPIYLYDINKFKKSESYSTCQSYLEALNSSISLSDSPLLVLVTDGTISTVYSTVGGSAGIEATLVDLMEANEE